MANPGGERKAAWARRALPRGNAAAVLPVAIFWSTLDRSLILPLVPGIAADLQAPVALAATAITTHALAYALLQIVWGPLSTRWGRVRVLTVSTSLAAVANAAAALSPDITTLLIARTASGGAFAATFAAVLTYVGDTMPLRRRPAAMSNLATATALGLALGTLVSGLIGGEVSWRWIFAVYAVVTAVLVPFIAALPEAGPRESEPLVAQVARLGRNGWALAVCAITAVEGFLLIGVYNLLPVALQQAGGAVLVSGLATSAFGIAVVVVSQLMKLVVHRVRPAWFLVAGGACATLAFLALAARVDPATVVFGAAAMGTGWALAHTTLQTWMTDAAAPTRALGMTLFSISLMLGGAAGAAAGAAAVEHHAFPVLFAASAAGAVAFAVVASATRWRYRVQDEAVAEGVK